MESKNGVSQQVDITTEFAIKMSTNHEIFVV